MVLFGLNVMLFTRKYLCGTKFSKIFMFAIDFLIFFSFANIRELQYLCNQFEFCNEIFGGNSQKYKATFGYLKILF
jgi:hypothetical protein